MQLPRSRRLIKFLRKADLGRDMDRMLREVEDEIDSVLPVVPGRSCHHSKFLFSGISTTLIRVDMDRTVDPFHPDEPDETFGIKIFWTLECSNGTDFQVRQGDVGAAVCLKGVTFIVDTKVEDATAAESAGTLNLTFSWVTSGAVAELQVTAVTTLIPGVTPMELEINYFVFYASHTSFTYSL